MTRDYRKRFEKIFHDCNSVSELLLKFDVSHINYPEETWPKMKYLFKILKTFRHSKDLDNDFIAWTYAHAREVVNAEMASQWLSNMVYKVSNTKVNRSKFNTNLNTILMLWWIREIGIKLVPTSKKHRKSKGW